MPLFGRQQCRFCQIIWLKNPGFCHPNITAFIATCSSNLHVIKFWVCWQECTVIMTSIFVRKHLSTICIYSIYIYIYLSDCVSTVSAASGRYRLRSTASEAYILPRTRTRFGEHGFFYSGPAVWNTLPSPSWYYWYQYISKTTQECTFW